jgi:dTMP kinase
LQPPCLSVRSHPGLLIAVEGVSRSGKSVLLGELAAHYRDAGEQVVQVAWNSDADISPVITSLKARRELSPMVFSLLHLADLAATYHKQILPALDAGAVVLSDRYVFTAWVRDSLRGIPAEVLNPLLREFCKPDASFLVEGDISEIGRRFDLGSKTYGHYGLGRDVVGDLTPRESFLAYQRLQQVKYWQLAEAGLLIPICNRPGAAPDEVLATVLAAVLERVPSRVAAGKNLG